MPRQYKLLAQDPLGGGGIFSPEELWDLIFSPLHVGLRSIDGLLRLACLLFIDSPVCSAVLKEQYDYFMRLIQEAYLNRGDGYRKLYIKFVTPDGGDTING